MRKITTKDREAMFTAFTEAETINHVVEKCGVHHLTAEKYRKLDKWDERLAEIRAKAEEKADETAAQRRARLITTAKFVQAKALAYLKKNGFDSATSAVSGLFKALQAEAELTGDIRADTEVRLVLDYRGDAGTITAHTTKAREMDNGNR